MVIKSDFGLFTWQIQNGGDEQGTSLCDEQNAISKTTTK